MSCTFACWAILTCNSRCGTCYTKTAWLIHPKLGSARKRFGQLPLPTPGVMSSPSPSSNSSKHQGSSTSSGRRKPSDICISQSRVYTPFKIHAGFGGRTVLVFELALASISLDTSGVRYQRMPSPAPGSVIPRKNSKTNTAYGKSAVK